jgi:hypothetical protein
MNFCDEWDQDETYVNPFKKGDVVIKPYKKVKSQLERKLEDPKYKKRFEKDYKKFLKEVIQLIRRTKRNSKRRKNVS